MRIRRKATHPYHGRRGGRDLYVPAGSEQEIADDIARGLMKDVPRDWERVGRVGEDSGSASPGAAIGDDQHEPVKSPPPASPMAHEQAPAPGPAPRPRSRGKKARA